MQDFSFHRPSSVADAVAMLRAAPEGKLLSGGQSYLPVLKLGLAAPTDLISLRNVPELKGFSVEGNRLVVGAAQTHDSVLTSSTVSGAIKALAQLAGGIGDAQVRNRGTLGGSLAHADPAADYPAALLALDGHVHTDHRTIPADGFFNGLFSTVLEKDEVITKVSFAIPQKAAYQKFAHPASKYAVVGVFVAHYGGTVRVGVTGAAQSAFRWTAAEQALAASWSAGSVPTFTGGDLNDDPDFSAEYRAHLIGVLARRAVSAA